MIHGLDGVGVEPLAWGDGTRSGEQVDRGVECRQQSKEHTWIEERFVALHVDDPTHRRRKLGTRNGHPMGAGWKGRWRMQDTDAHVFGQLAQGRVSGGHGELVGREWQGAKGAQGPFQYGRPATGSRSLCGSRVDARRAGTTTATSDQSTVRLPFDRSDRGG